MKENAMKINDHRMKNDEKLKFKLSIPILVYFFRFYSIYFYNLELVSYVNDSVHVAFSNVLCMHFSLSLAFDGSEND